MINLAMRKRPRSETTHYTPWCQYYLHVLTLDESRERVGDVSVKFDTDPHPLPRA